MSLLLLVAGLVCTPVRAQGLTGASSLVAIPTAQAWADASVAAGLNVIPNVCLNKCPEPEAGFSGVMGIQFLPFLQVGLRIWRTSYERYENQQGIGDRSFILRLRIWDETTWRPAVSVGARDPLVNTPQFSASYVVASKSLPSASVLAGVAVHAGYGLPGHGAVNYPLEGVFGGVSYVPHPAVRMLLEYDSRYVNAGLAVNPLAGLELTASLFRLADAGAGLTYTFEL